MAKGKKSSKGTDKDSSKEQRTLQNQPAVMLGGHQAAVDAAFEKKGFSLQDLLDAVKGLPWEQIMALIHLLASAKQK